MSRTRSLLAGLDLTGLAGLEIGALNNPVLRRPDARVFYVDHADTAALRAKYEGDPAVAPRDLVEVDYVWTTGSLAAVVGGRRFGYVVASHVIEHVPDVIWWLSELASVMAPFGALRLAIPDKRFTFDFLRQETTVADALAAWVGQERRPNARSILDFWGHHRVVAADAAWHGVYPADTGFHLHEMRAALGRAADAVQNGSYHDVHCSVFTPAGFVGLMRSLAALGLLGFGCTQVETTARGSLEFFVHLMRMEDAAKREESWDWAAWTVGEQDRAARSVLRRVRAAAVALKAGARRSLPI